MLARDLAKPALPPLTALARLNSKGALASLTLSLAYRTLSLCSFQATCPPSRFLKLSLFAQSLPSSSLAIRGCLLAFSHQFPLLQMHHSSAWRKGILEIQPHSWAPLSSRPSGTLSSTSLKSPKSALSSPGQGVHWVTGSLSRGSPTPTSRGHCSQGCLGAPYSPPAPPIGEHTASVLAGSSVTCARELSVTHSRNLPHGLCPATLPLQKISLRFKTPLRPRARKRKTTTIRLYGASSTPSSRRDGPVPDPNPSNIPCLWFPLNLDPQALQWLLILSQEHSHTFHLLTETRTAKPRLASTPSFPNCLKPSNPMPHS